MSNSDEKNYLNALKDIDTNKKPDDSPIIQLCENSAKKLEFIMTFMEWNLTTAINSSIVYAYKKSKDDLLKPVDSCKPTEGEKIKLELSIKNSNRIESLIIPEHAEHAQAYSTCVINSIFILFDLLTDNEIE